MQVGVGSGARRNNQILCHVSCKFYCDAASYLKLEAVQSILAQRDCIIDKSINNQFSEWRESSRRFSDVTFSQDL